ncbi:hypothetical protein MRX96_007538 [Rhipicephalus microplus]
MRRAFASASLPPCVQKEHKRSQWPRLERSCAASGRSSSTGALPVDREINRGLAPPSLPPPHQRAPTD